MVKWISEAIAIPSNTPEATLIPPEELIRQCWLNLDLLAQEAQ